MRRLALLLLLLIGGSSVAVWAVLGRPLPDDPDAAPQPAAVDVAAVGEPAEVEEPQRSERRRVRPSRERVQRGASDEAAADAVRRLTELAERRRRQQADLEAAKARLRKLAPQGGPQPVGDGKNGPFVAYHGDGRVYREGFFVDGRRDGLWVETFPSGGRTETEYRLGEKHGREAGWHPDGTNKYLGDFRDGEMHGTWTAWHDSGVVAMTRTFEDGQLQGVLRRFHENGVLAEESWFEAGLEVGTNRGWFADGTLAWEIGYAQGRRHGRATWWYPDGALETEATYEAGQFHGDYVVYDEAGEVSHRDRFDHGEIVDSR